MTRCFSLAIGVFLTILSVSFAVPEARQLTAKDKPDRNSKFKAQHKAQDRLNGINNLKRINLSLHDYNGVFKKLPAMASFDKNGKPLLSWRVHILPFLHPGYQELYKQFKLNEPWDSPHNKNLIAKMPPAFRSPYSKAKPFMTTYLAPVGFRTVFSKRAIALSDISNRDGTSNTAWIVDADDSHAVIWTKPADLSIDLQNPHRGLRLNSDREFMVSIVDGSVRLVPIRISVIMLNRLFDCKDGMVVEYPK